MWNQIKSNSSSIQTKRIVFCLYFVIMAIQLIPIEGYSVSPLKVASMSLAPLFIISFGYALRVSNVLFWGVLNLLLMMVCALLASHLVGWNRIVYRAMYIIMFVGIYYIIYDGCINIAFFKRLLLLLIISHCTIIILQYALHFIGIKELPFINYFALITMKGVLKPNGLTLEPSHTARILTVLYWGLIKTYEIENNCKLSFRDTIKIVPYHSFLFYFSMLIMGSATAIIGILLILFYLFNRNIGFFLICVIGFILMMNVDIDNIQIQRVQNVFNSLFSDDVSTTLQRKEGSGAVRIMPFINTLRMDLFSIDTWIGQGSYSNPNIKFIDKVFSESRYIGDITSFGLISYIASLIFVYKCCIRKFYSMETLIFFVLATFSVGSVYYTWLMLILFTLIKYFEEQKLNGMDLESKEYKNE